MTYSDRVGDGYAVLAPNSGAQTLGIKRLEYKNTKRRERQWDEEVKAKEETVKENILNLWRHKFWKFIRSKPTIVAPSWVWCVMCVAVSPKKLWIGHWYLKKEGRDEVDFLHADKHQNIVQTDTSINLDEFCMQINIKVSCTWIPASILISMARSAQVTRNNKFAKYLEYLKKEKRDEVDFLCREHPSFL